MPELTWQERFDADFPHGMVMHWYGDPTGPRYHVEAIEVITVENDLPEVHLDADAQGKAFDLHLTLYRVLATDPVAAHVSGMSIPDMLWSAAG